MAEAETNSGRCIRVQEGGVRGPWNRKRDAYKNTELSATRAAVELGEPQNHDNVTVFALSGSGTGAGMGAGAT